MAGDAMKRYDEIKKPMRVGGDEKGPWERYRRIRSCLKRRSIDELRGAGLRGGIALCGSGPSIAGQLDEIRRLVRAGYKVAAVNTAHDYLWDNGIQVDLAAVLDARPWVATYFKKPRRETTRQSTTSWPLIFTPRTFRRPCAMIAPP